MYSFVTLSLGSSHKVVCMVLSVTTKRTQATVQHDRAARQIAKVPIDTRASIGQLAVVRPRPAAGLTVPAKIVKGTRLDDPPVLKVVVHDESKLPNVAAVKGKAIAPRTSFFAAVHCCYCVWYRYFCGNRIKRE
jgi:hypothetical protein